MGHLRNPSILGVSLLGAALLWAAPASAAVSIAVSPAILEIEGSAGAQGGVDIRVSNSGDEAFDLITGVTEYQQMTGDRSAVPWATVTPDRLHLEPGDDLATRLTIDIPADAVSGGRYAAVTLSTVEPGSEGTTGLAGRIVVPVLLTVDGTGDLVRTTVFERAALFLAPDGRLGGRAEVRNDGNVHVPLAGGFAVSSPSSDLSASIGIPMGRVLPGAVRTYEGDATLPLPLGSTYRVRFTMETGDPEAGATEPLIDETFEIVADASVRVEGVALCENLDKGPSMTAVLVNEGQLGLVPSVSFELLEDGANIGSARVPDVPLWPGDSAPFAVDLADRLPSGAYTLRVTATYGPDQTTESQLSFTIGGDPATAAPLCHAIPRSTASPDPGAVTPAATS